MSTCATCGRQRNGTTQFCDGCGAEFSDPAPEEPPAARTDPFASWYQREEPPQATGVNWRPTETVQATPPQPTGFPSPSYAPPPPQHPTFPPGPPVPPTAPPTRGGGRALFIAAAIVVVLAAGGGAYALAASLGKHSGAQPPAQPTVGASTPASGTTPSAASPGTASSTSPTPSPTLSLVAVSPGVTNAAEPQVETLLSHYFHGINTHNYAEYAGTLNAAQQAQQTQSQFQTGYSTTTDSAMTLTSLTDNGSGGLTATVTFTSRQSPAQSVDNSACNTWTINYYLVSQGNGYLIGPAPAGYQPTHSDC